MIFKDLKVIELASVLAGPSVGMFFAELGATVIKVESPNGDITRSWKLNTENEQDSRSAYFSSVNWGKKNRILNLKDENDRVQVYSLVKEADIVIVSYKPGDEFKLQMDYETLKTYNKKIIYGQITGFGEEIHRVGYDAIVQAESGLMYMNGSPNDKPTKLPIAFVDLLAAHQLKEGLLAALYHREKTGIGSKVEASLIDSALATLTNQSSNYLVANHIPQRMGSEHPNIVPYGTVYPTKDNQYVVLAIGSDKQFFHLCFILNIPEIAEDKKFNINIHRVKHRKEINAILENALLNFDAKPFIDLCVEANIPVGIVNDMKAVMETDYAKSMLLEGTTIKGLRTVGFKADFFEKMDLCEPPILG